MKKLFQLMKKKPGMLYAANAMAMVMLMYSANAACLWVHNQPEMPEAVRRFRRF